MLNVPSGCILGLTTLIAAGCGSGSGRPTVPPTDASSPRNLSALEPSTEPPAPVMKAEEEPRRVPGLRRDRETPLRAPAVATGVPELDPLVAYLKASFAWEIKHGQRLVIGDMTDTSLRYNNAGHALPEGGYQGKIDRLLRQASDQVPAEMIRDFGEKNRERHAVWPELTRHLPASLMTLSESKAIFSGFDDDGWKRFYIKYPDAYGIINVSCVGFNRDKTLAFFYVDVRIAPLNAHGQFHVLKKEGDAWVELPVEIGGTWTA